jgi:hypothetical protein
MADAPNLVGITPAPESSAPVIRATQNLRNARFWLHLLAIHGDVNWRELAIHATDKASGATQTILFTDFLMEVDHFLGDIPIPEIDVRVVEAESASPGGGDPRH